MTLVLELFRVRFFSDFYKIKNILLGSQMILKWVPVSNQADKNLVKKYSSNDVIYVHIIVLFSKIKNN